MAGCAPCLLKRKTKGGKSHHSAVCATPQHNSQSEGNLRSQNFYCSDTAPHKSSEHLPSLAQGRKKPKTQNNLGEQKEARKCWLVNPRPATGLLYPNIIVFPTLSQGPEPLPAGTRGEEDILPMIACYSALGSSLYIQLLEHNDFRLPEISYLCLRSNLPSAWNKWETSSHELRNQ